MSTISKTDANISENKNNILITLLASICSLGPLATDMYSPTSNNEEVQKKRLELFHYEYQREQQQYQWQKEREEDEKLNAILRYTRDTFKRFDLEEIEIYQICESVLPYHSSPTKSANTYQGVCGPFHEK